MIVEFLDANCISTHLQVDDGTQLNCARSHPKPPTLLHVVSVISISKRSRDP